MRLARRDYERVLAFLEAAHAVKGPSPFTPELLDRLASIASCEAATFLEHVPGRNDVSSCVTWSGEDPDVLIRQAADPAKWASTRTAELTRRKSRSGGPVVLADLFPRRLRRRYRFVVVDCEDVHRWGGTDTDWDNATHVNRLNMRRMLRYVVAHSDGALR